MKKILGTISLAGIIGIMAAGAALAGTSDPVIQQREANQEGRIEQGIKQLRSKTTGAEAQKAQSA